MIKQTDKIQWVLWDLYKTHSHSLFFRIQDQAFYEDTM